MDNIFFKITGDVTSQVTKYFAIFMLYFSTVLVCFGILYWAIVDHGTPAIGAALTIYGITGMISAFFLRGIAFATEAAVLYLRKEGQLDEEDDEEDIEE